MKSLNLRSFIAVLFIAASTLVSCKKESVPPPAQPTAAGVWEGKYGNGQIVPGIYFSFVINANGTMEVRSQDKNNPDIGTGTWTIDNDTFKGIYYYGNPDSKFNVIAKINLENGTMTGDWGHGEVVADKGTFYMNKQ